MAHEWPGPLWNSTIGTTLVDMHCPEELYEPIRWLFLFVLARQLCVSLGVCMGNACNSTKVPTT